MPGLSARIRDPETDAELPIFSSGLLWLRGANLFEGYLDDPTRTAAVIHDGWYKTGDVGRLDEDGFLFIEGRMSRFSKIAGEMVPHLTIEQKIAEALHQSSEPQDGPSVVVVGVPDEKKGESPGGADHHVHRSSRVTPPAWWRTACLICGFQR